MHPWRNTRKRISKGNGHVCHYVFSVTLPHLGLNKNCWRPSSSVMNGKCHRIHSKHVGNINVGHSLPSGSMTVAHGKKCSRNSFNVNFASKSFSMTVDVFGLWMLNEMKRLPACLCRHPKKWIFQLNDSPCVMASDT